VRRTCFDGRSIFSCQVEKPARQVRYHARRVRTLYAPRLDSAFRNRVHSTRMGSSRLLSPQDELSSRQGKTLSVAHALSCDGETTTKDVVVFLIKEPVRNFCSKPASPLARRQLEHSSDKY